MLVDRRAQDCDNKILPEMIENLTVLMETDGRKSSKHKMCSFYCKALNVTYVLTLIYVSFENGVPVQLFKFTRVGVEDRENADLDAVY